MRRNVYNSPNIPNGNQDPNSNDGTGGLPTSPNGDGTGGLPESWQQGSPSPSDNPPPRLKMEEMREQQRIEYQIREDRRRPLEASNGQAGGTEQQLGYFRRVRQRIDSDGVNGEGGGFAGARGSARTAELIESGAPLNQIIPPQINNQINNPDAPPQGVVDQQPPIRLITPNAPMREAHRSTPGGNGFNETRNLFQNMYNRTFTAEQQQRFLQAQQPVQLTPEQQAGQQRILQAQQIATDSLQRAAEALERVREGQQRAAEALEIAREAQQRALDLQAELIIPRQDAPLVEDLPRPAPQQIQPQEQQLQERPATPETYPMRPNINRDGLSNRQPGGGKEGGGL